jgi:hypothetical protein
MTQNRDTTPGSETTTLTPALKTYQRNMAAAA